MGVSTETCAADSEIVPIMDVVVGAGSREALVLSV